ncbi:MAG TPA: ComEC/Rec2 family competence protein [Parcubacteria group bacterium]|nr:ComEC/Rec2 family competence protein [Parcubacteria group bacterium]
MFVASAIYVLDRNVLILITLVAASLGILRYDIKDFHELVPAGNIGIVVSEPENRDKDTRYTVLTDTGEKVLVTDEIYSKVLYGDEVRLTGTPKILKPSGYADYLAKDDIFYTLERAKVEILSHDNGNGIKGALIKVKGFLIDKIKNILPEPEASLLSGLIVSGKQALPKETLESFKDAGVVHMVVLSGYNITIIAEFLLIVFAFLGSRFSGFIALVGVVLFTIMSGAPATVVRGAIMVSFLLFGRLMKRPGSPQRILLFTAVLMLMHNPKILLYDPSFQLSFLAVLGLIYGAPIIQDKLAKLALPAHGRASGHSRAMPTWLTELLATTLATQVFVLPLLLYSMGNFSLVFLFANLLILPILPVVMLIGFVGTLLSFVLGVLAMPINFITHTFLAYILKIADLFGNLPFSSLEIENFPLWGSLVMYLLIFIIVWHSRNSSPHSPSLG